MITSNFTHKVNEVILAISGRRVFPLHFVARYNHNRILPHMKYIPLFILLLCFRLNNAYARPQPVFIATNPKSAKSVSSAIDAAMALNSIQFMEMLIGIKNAADIKTYTQSTKTANDDHSPIKRDNEEIRSILSWTRRIIPSFVGGRLSSSVHEEMKDKTADSSHIKCSTPQIKSTWILSNPCPKHETVAEYVGQLWFLNKGGIKFRETIKVVAISSDGRSSTVECNTEYHNGEKWISCSKIICEFRTHRYDEIEGISKNDGSVGVKMHLTCELLVWLPLPSAAKKGVRNKISSVFKNVALEFLGA